jgi:hypothetical protein
MLLTLLQSGGAPPATNTLWLRVGGTWRQATLWLRVSGTWKATTPRVKVGGTWR